MSSRRLVLGGVFFAFALASFPRDAAAFCRMTTEGGAQIGEAACVEKGAPFFWANPCLSYAIDRRGSRWMSFDEVEAAVDLAFEAWENADCNGAPPNLVFHPDGPSTCKRAACNGDGEGNVNTIAFLDPWEDECRTADEPMYDSRAFAVTIVWHNTSTGEILDADMMINDQRASRVTAGGPYANCPETGCEGDLADLGSIVTHEAGHFIGIGHCNPENPDDPNDPCVQATMFAVADRSSVEKRTLAPDDIDAVCTIYPPGNLQQDCNAEPRDGLQLDCETDLDGSAISCERPTCVASSGGGGGCSAGGTPSNAPWGVVVATLVGLSAWRRRRVAGS